MAIARIEPAFGGQQVLTKTRKMFYRARGYYAGQLAGESYKLDPYHSSFWRKAAAGNWAALPGKA